MFFQWTLFVENMYTHCMCVFCVKERKNVYVLDIYVCLYIPLFPKARTISSTNHLFWHGVGVWSAAWCMHESLRGYVHDVSCMHSSLGIAMHHAVGWCMCLKGFWDVMCARVYRYQPMVYITFVMGTQWYVMVFCNRHAVLLFFNMGVSGVPCGKEHGAHCVKRA